MCEFAKGVSYVTMDKILSKDQLVFARNQHGQPDVSMFEFATLYQSKFSSQIIENNGKQVFLSLVGDSLLEVRTKKD